MTLRRFKKQERGISLLAIVGLMLVASIFGLALNSIVTTSHATNLEHVYYDRAFYTTQTGIEYAMRKIYDGVSPVVPEPGVDFSGGRFTVARDGKIVTVAGIHAASQVVHSFESPVQAKCTVFDFSNADLSNDGKWLNKIQFRKTCLEVISLDKMKISWNDANTQGVQKVRVENDVLYNAPDPPVGSDQMIELVNYYVMAQNNQNNFNEIRFTNDMTGKAFTMTFYLGDGSTVSQTFTPQ